MTELLLAWLQNFPPELAVVILAALPVTELRASIPVGISVFHLPALSALLYSLLGNGIVVPILLWVLPRIRDFFEKHSSSLAGFFDRYVHRKRALFQASYDRWGAFALLIFVAIPLPLTGVWTGSLLAVIFHIPAKRSLPAILGGMTIAGILVTLIVEGTLGFLSWVL